MSSEGVDLKKRRFLTAATAVVGAVGAGFVAVPFIASWNPSERAKALGAPEEADISKLEPGALLRLKWRGKVTWVVRRTEQNIADLKTLDGKLADPDSEVPQQPSYARNATRSIKPEYAVLVGICTHLGCSPDLPSRGGTCGSRPRLEGRLFLPLPWFELRSGRSCLQRGAGTHQSGGTATPVPVGRCDPDRC